MADGKYGRIFTESDVEKILEWIAEQGEGQPLDLDNTLAGMEQEDVRFKFPKDEPLFLLRGRDKRSLAAVRYYMEHQSPRAPQNHLDGIESAVSSFERYRRDHANDMKEPD